MRFSAQKKKILIVIIGILIILSLNFFQKEVKGFFYLISAPIQKNLWEVGDRTADFFEALSEIKSLKRENEELKLEIQKLLAENSSLKELKQENQAFREALEIDLQKDFILIFAEVIGKDIGQDSILINKGSKDGILEGFPVTTPQRVLLGRIAEVYKTFSRVMLISSEESSFDAKIADTDILGVVKGTGRLKLCLDFIPKDKEIKEGDLVISTSIGGIYPKNLLAGLIKEVKKSDINPFQLAEISPFFNIEEVKTVFVIKDY